MTDGEIESFYKVALAKINDEYRAPLVKEFESITPLDEEKRKELQHKIIDAYLNQDRFRIYHLAKLKKIDTKKIISDSKNGSFRFDFISKPNYSDWSMTVEESKGTIQLIFAKYSQRQIRNTDTSSGAEDYIKIPYFFLIKVEIIPTAKESFLVISMPSFRPIPFGSYEYNSEIEYVYSWLYNYEADVEPLDYKEVFEKLDPKIFDKFGYKGEDIKSEESGIINAIFHLKLTNRETKSKELHDTINTLIGPQLAEIILTQMEDVWDADGVIFKEGTRDKMLSSLSGMKFSEKYTSLLHSACEYGVGYVKLPTASSTQEYSLEYTKTGNGLIRSKCEKWTAFKPLYEAIVANHSGT